MATDNQKFRQMSSLVSAWRTSGTGKKAFCAAHEINVHTFTYWVEKLEKVDKERPTLGLKTRGFIALEEPESAPKAHIELRFPQGAVLRMAGLLNAESLALVKSLLY
jgi:hypothetical protein